MASRKFSAFPHSGLHTFGEQAAELCVNVAPVSKGDFSEIGSAYSMPLKDVTLISGDIYGYRGSIPADALHVSGSLEEQDRQTPVRGILSSKQIGWLELIEEHGS